MSDTEEVGEEHWLDFVVRSSFIDEWHRKLAGDTGEEPINDDQRFDNEVAQEDEDGTIYRSNEPCITRNNQDEKRIIYAKNKRKRFS